MTDPAAASSSRSADSSPAPSQTPSPAKPRPKQQPVNVSYNRRLLILALRYVVSSKEYAVLRRKVLLKAPSPISSATPKRSEWDSVVGHPSDKEDYLPAATRAGLRTLLVGTTALNTYGYLTARLRSRRDGSIPPKLRQALFDRGGFMSALSMAVLIVVHRVLYRFFARLRTNLMLPQAKTFRVKYPKASKVFLSPLAPPLASSLAGFALAIHPKSERRVTIAAYMFVKALEFHYNRLEDEGWFDGKPAWLGSWLLFPLASGQLLHSFVFERDCFPSEYEPFITKYSEEYLQSRPTEYPPQLPWPDISTTLNAIGKIANLRYPPFSSPILFPESNTIPPMLSEVAPVISPAHPTITSLHCALTHPTEPSCLKTYIHFWASELPRILKFIFAIYSVAWIPRYKRLIADPPAALQKIATATSRTSLFISGTLGTAFASLCFFQKFLPRSLLPQARFYLAGLIAGLWAAVEAPGSRANFLYAFRIFLVSAWKTLKKKGYVKSVKNGDVLLFVCALAAVNSVYDQSPEAISGGAARRVLSSLRGKGLKDWVVENDGQEKREGKREKGEEKSKKL